MENEQNNVARDNLSPDRNNIEANNFETPPSAVQRGVQENPPPLNNEQDAVDNDLEPPRIRRRLNEGGDIPPLDLGAALDAVELPDPRNPVNGARVVGDRNLVSPTREAQIQSQQESRQSYQGSTFQERDGIANERNEAASRGVDAVLPRQDEVGVRSNSEREADNEVSRASQNGYVATIREQEGNRHR